MTDCGKDDAEGAESPITVQRFPSGDVAVHVFGELLDAEALQRTITAELAHTPSPPRLAVDLTRVTAINAAGVEALVSTATTTGESDISFCLIGMTAAVEGVIAAAELTELFEVFASIEEAWGAQP